MATGQRVGYAVVGWSQACSRDRCAARSYAPVAVAQLLDRAIADRDLVMTAMGLAMGAHDPGWQWAISLRTSERWTARTLLSIGPSALVATG